MKKILLTGANGFIGRNLKECISSENDVFSPSSMELDLIDTESVRSYLKRNPVDIVLHTATWNATANTPKDHNMVLEKNLLMYFNLVRNQDLFGKLIYYGSGAEYCREHYIPSMNEEYFDTYVPKDHYGLSKFIMAKYAGLTDNIIDLRVFGCFGKYEDWEIRFISNAICKALYGLPITIRQNVFFDYIWVEDLVAITKWFLVHECKYKHYNACTSTRIDLVTLAKKVCEIVGTKVPIIVGQTGYKLEYSGNNSRLMEEMGGFDFTSLDDSISILSNYYKDNLKMIDKGLLLIDKH